MCLFGSCSPLTHIAALSSLPFPSYFLLPSCRSLPAEVSRLLCFILVTRLSPPSCTSNPPPLQQQLQAQHLSQHAQGLPVGPHPSGLPHPGLALGGGSGLLALSGALGAQLAAKDERAHLEAAAAAAAAAEHHRGTETLRRSTCMCSYGNSSRTKYIVVS